MKRKRPRESAEPWYEFKAQADETSAELHIFGPIGGGFFWDEDAVTGKSIAEKLDELPENIRTVRVLVNSPGGSVFDAIHIANALRRQREELDRNVEVDIEALAASAATIVTSAGNPIRMPRNALMMIHNPWGLGIGDSDEMRSLADVLDKIRNTIIATYRWVSKLSVKKLGKLMDDETWMEADEAVENGLVTEISAPVKAMASIDPQALSHLGEIPNEYRDRVMALIEPAQSDKKEGDAIALVKNKEDRKMPPKKTEPQNTAPDPVEPTPQAIADAEEAARKAERSRVMAILAVVKTAITAGLSSKIANTIGDAAIKMGDTIDSVREEIFAALGQKSDEPGPDAVPPGITPGEDERDKRVRGISAALWQRAGISDLIRKAAKKHPDNEQFKVELDPGEFRGMSLLDHCRDSLERNRPGSSRGRTKMQLAGDFFAHEGGHQTTSDFSTALEEALHKTLLASYALQPDKWRRFCAIGTVSDFRVHNRYRLGFLAGLDIVGEGGEFTNKELADATKETQQAVTRGNILALSRQAIINDDMGVFNGVAVTLGRAAGLSIELAVFALLAENSGMGPAMNDGTTMFHADHSNVGAGAAISVTALDADRVIMAAQTDESGNEILDLRPTKLLVPAGLEGAARVINSSQWDHTTGTDVNKPNMIQGLFDDIIGTGRLTGTRRYMFADPTVAPVIEVAFLEGEQEPFMEIQDGWRVDGVEWKVRHDFGVSGIGYRGALTDAGA
jgi:ATP-dependent protease ClpP protease subunit